MHTSTSDFLFIMFIHHLYNNLQTEYQSKYTLGNLALTPNESNLPLWKRGKVTLKTYFKGSGSQVQNETRTERKMSY